MNPFLVILLIVAGVALICTELFVPGMIFGTIGTISLLTGLGGAFTFGTRIGIITFIAVFIFTSVVIKLILNKLPDSKLGKGIIMQEKLPSSGSINSDVNVGEIGVAFTKLRPAGTAIIRDMRIDVVTEGMMIENGTEVKVIKVEGNRVTVRELNT